MQTGWIVAGRFRGFTLIFCIIRAESRSSIREEKSMAYFVTGATGFIGRFLVERLLERGGAIHVLVRKGSLGKLEELRARWGVDDKRVVAVVGDLAKPKLGLSA